MEKCRTANELSVLKKECILVKKKKIFLILRIFKGLARISGL